jgi:ADP-ribose pyrophosphatase YjhB (NUDIX family)
MTGADSVPRLPVSVGALITDESGRLLVVKPTYKSGWTLPGGQMEADGETPWDACRREVLEECGLSVQSGRLRCVDFLRPRPDHAGGLRLLFECGTVDAEQIQSIVVQAGEIAEFRFVGDEEADDLLREAVRRRVRAVRGTSEVVYLEEGQAVDSVSG